MGQRLEDRVGPWFDKAFAKEPDDVLWTMTPMVHSTKGILLYVGAFAPGAIVGTVMSAGLAIPHPTEITEGGAAEIVQGIMDQIAEGRSRQLAEGMPSNGSLVIENSMDGLAAD